MEEDQDIGNKLISITLHSIEDKSITDNKLIRYFPQTILDFDLESQQIFWNDGRRPRNQENIIWMK